MSVPAAVRSRAVRQSIRLALGTASALGLARFAYGLLVPAMRTDLHWTLAQSGALTTANAFGYLLGALVTAAVIRRLGSATTFRVGMALTSLALALTSVSGDYPLLLTMRAVAGVTGALVFISGGVIAARLSARAQSAAPIIVYFSGTGLGIALSGGTIPALVDTRPGTWPVAWIGLGIVAGLATLASWTATDVDSDAPRGGLGRVRLRPLWRIAVAYVWFAAGYIAYITFLSAFLTAHHASTAQVSLVWTVLGVAVIAGPALWNRPIDTWAGARALAAMLAVLGGAAALPMSNAALAVVVASAIGYGVAFMGVPAAITALIRERTPSADWAPTLATFTALFAAGQTVGPWVAGVLADHTTTGATLAWTAVLCTGAAILSATDRATRATR